MVDDAITYLETVRERPVWQPVPDEVAADSMRQLLTSLPAPMRCIRNFWRAYFPIRWQYPSRFWAWYMGNGQCLAPWRIHAAIMIQSGGASRCQFG